MKKQILELLRELKKYCSNTTSITFLEEHSGYISLVMYDATRVCIQFTSETELIQGLKDKIKELKK